MTVEEIINYYLENYKPISSSISTVPLNVPIIESWLCVDIRNKVVIHGQIYNHSQYPAGEKLKSSPIQGCLTREGRVYITTKNSVYELGIPSSDFDTISINNKYKVLEAEKLADWEKY